MSIDKRVVEMQFDNKQFESGVQTSLKSIDKLKTGLNFDESARSLSSLDKASKSFSLAGMAQGIESISNKFSTLGIIGITALTNLTNSAVNFGKNLIKSLTIDPVKSGLQEYETKLNSIQTILTNTESKGTTLDDVNKTLAVLNDYADQTIYNFAEMTRNIGTFTAAGIELDTAAESIKGIANLAAGSGSNAQQASTAMYQLSQAMASGTVKLMDWNSVVNAGMGGELFQKALEKTAEELGNGRDMSVSFRESLQDGWITAEVLTKTLQKFANDKSLITAATQVKTFTQLLDTMKESVQSGWAVSWEHIIGNKDEAAATLTALNNAFGAIVGPISDARNETLKFWHDNGGRDAIIESLVNAFNGLMSIVKPIKEAFGEIFSPINGEVITNISKEIRDLTANFKMGEETATNLKRTFKGLFALLDIGKQAFMAIAGGLVNLLKYLLPAGDGVLSFTGSIGDWLVNLNEAIKKGDIFNKSIQKIGDFLGPIAEGIKTTIGTIIEWFKSFGNIDLSGLDTFSDRVKARFEPFTKIWEVVKNAFSKIVDVIKKVVPVFWGLASVVGDAISRMGTNILNAVDNSDFNSIFDIINTGIFAGILLGLRKFISSLTSIGEGAGGFLSGITGILDGVKGSLEAYQAQLKAGTLLKIAIAIGILAAALVALSLIDSEKLTGSLAAMTAMFVDLFGSMAIFEKIMGSAGFKGIGKVTTAMIGLSVAILILSVALTKLAKLNWGEIAKGITAVTALSAILVGVAKLLSANEGSMIKGATGFVIFAAAILVLTEAVERFGKIDLIQLAKGLGAVGVLVAELALFMKVANLDGMSIGKGVGLIALAAAILILAEAVKKFGDLDIEVLGKGLAAVAIVLTELALFVNLTGDASRVISTAIGLTILGAAMLIFASAIEKMGNMQWEVLGRGLVAMAAALAIITVAINLMPKNMILTGAGLVVIAASLLILAQALKNMGDMSWGEIAKGLVTLAASLGIISIAMMLMTGALPGAAALFVVAAALAVLTPVLKSLGEMSLAEIGTALLALAGVFVVLGVSGLVLAPLTPVILALGVAVALLGVGMLATGAGLLAFSAGLAALAVSGAAGAAALVVIVTSIIGLVPMMFKAVGEGLIEFSKVIGEKAVVLVDAISKLIVAILDKVIELSPKFSKAGAVLITGFLQVIIDTTPKIIEAIFVILKGLLAALVDYIPKVVEAGMLIIIGFLKGISDNIGKVVSTAIDIVVNFLEAIGKETPRIVDAAFKMIIDFINGLSDAIRENTKLVITAVNNLMDALLGSAVEWVKNAVRPVGPLIKIGADMIRGIIEGIKSMATEIWKALKEVFGGVIDFVMNLFDEHSPSKVFADIGMNVDKGFVNGLKKFSGLVETASENVGVTAVDTLKEAVSNISDVISGDMDLSPTIKPVIDLTNVKTGVNAIGSLLGTTQGINVSGTANKASSITQSTQSADTNATTSQSTDVPSVAFVQNNYSPKALSRLDIYRQTKNQFSALKGLVST